MAKYHVTVVLATGEQHEFDTDETPTYPYLGTVTVAGQSFAEPRHVEVVEKPKSKPRATSKSKTARRQPAEKSKAAKTQAADEKSGGAK